MQAHLTYKAQTHIYDLPENSDITALKDTVQRNLNLPPSHQKFLYKGRHLTDDAKVPTSGKIMLLASSQESVSAVHLQTEQLRLSAQRRAAAPKSTARLNKTWTQSDSDQQKYHFNRISVLEHLPDSDHSLKFLQRLANDGSIKRLMVRHRYSVGLLTEMDPRLHTSHDSKTLGLNKNAGAEILLRLRTDELDGWRDYKTVRVTLIHELAHNEFGQHDEHFWALFRLLSREVAEYESGTRLEPAKEVYVPAEAKQSDSGAVWTGGSGTLSGGTEHSGGDASGRGATMRDRNARAAEERNKKV